MKEIRKTKHTWDFIQRFDIKISDSNRLYRYIYNHNRNETFQINNLQSELGLEKLLGGRAHLGVCCTVSLWQHNPEGLGWSCHVKNHLSGVQRVERGRGWVGRCCAFSLTMSDCASPWRAEALPSVSQLLFFPRHRYFSPRHSFLCVCLTKPSVVW